MGVFHVAPLGSLQGSPDYPLGWVLPEQTSGIEPGLLIVRTDGSSQQHFGDSGLLGEGGRPKMGGRGPRLEGRWYALYVLVACLWPLTREPYLGARCRRCRRRRRLTESNDGSVDGSNDGSGAIATAPFPALDCTFSALDCTFSAALDCTFSVIGTRNVLHLFYVGNGAVCCTLHDIDGCIIPSHTAADLNCTRLL